MSVLAAVAASYTLAGCGCRTGGASMLSGLGAALLKVCRLSGLYK